MFTSLLLCGPLERDLSPYPSDGHRVGNWQTNPEGKGLGLPGVEQARLKGRSEGELGELSTSTWDASTLVLVPWGGCGSFKGSRSGG